MSEDKLNAKSVVKTGALHPGVAASRARLVERAIGVGVVYDKKGLPKLDPDFIANLNETQRKSVDANLADHGFKLNDQNVVEKL